MSQLEKQIQRHEHVKQSTKVDRGTHRTRMTADRKTGIGVEGNDVAKEFIRTVE